MYEPASASQINIFSNLTYQTMQADNNNNSNDSRPRLPQRTNSIVKISRRSGLKKQKNQRRIKTTGVCFDLVEIRFYERVCGDHPSCASGPPLSLGWDVLECISLSVEQFENDRSAMGSIRDFRLTAHERRKMLIHWGVSYSMIATAVRQSNHIKRQRRTTVNNLRTFDGWEEAVENVTRSVKQGLRLGTGQSSYKAVGKEVQDVEDDTTVCSSLSSLDCAIELEIRANR
jgi:hypothetical protein